MSLQITVLTYAVEKSRKTTDVLTLLKLKGYDNVCVYAKPFHYVKKFTPIYEHRPMPREEDLSLKELIAQLEYEYKEINSYEEIILPENSIVLICGGGILPDEFVDKYKVINAHPGYIPLVRGLDSLKWAIHERKPIGVTTHLISIGNVDAGEIIERKCVPIYEDDTFEMLALRQFQLEVQLLVEAIEHLEEKHEYCEEGGNPLHRRMPKDIEENLMQEYEEYKRQYFLNKI